MAVAKSFNREFNCWRKAAELASMQHVLDENATRARPFSKASLQPLSPLCQEYDKNVLRCWDFTEK